jgi:hypothetical protein
LAPSLPLLADFTSDGIPDQISANYLAYEVAVRPGRADGTFGDPISSFVRAPRGGASGVADLNRDGQLDVFVVSLWDNDTAWGNVLTNSGAGNFFTYTFPVDFVGHALVIPVAIGTGDLFGTGRTDVVVAGNTEDHSALYVVLANTSPVGPTLPGDYNGNGVVDAADYVMWRTMLGAHVPNYSGADGNGNGVVDQDDQAIWRSQFGQTLPAEAGSLVAAAPTTPEPATAVLFGAGLAAVCGIFFHRSQSRRTRHRANHRRALRRPRFEALEDRLTPSFAYWGALPPVEFGPLTGPDVAFAGDYSRPTGQLHLESADFNADGWNDLFRVTLSEPGYNHLGQINLTRTDGTFDYPLEFDPGPDPFWIATGDFNLGGFDGRADFAIYHYYGFDENGVFGILIDAWYVYRNMGNWPVVGPELPGDYNNNGTVDAADYVLWRDGGPLANEVDTPGTVNQADYTEWRARFGNPGSGSAAGVGPNGNPAACES